LEPIYSQIVAEAATESLGPLGFKRRGRSRLWLYDHGWILRVVWFQASRSPGITYLNVGVLPLWRPSTDAHADVVRRIHSSRWSLDGGDQWIAYRSEHQYRRAAATLAGMAAEEAERWKRFTDLADLTEILLYTPTGTMTWFGSFHAGILSGIGDDLEDARRQLEPWKAYPGGSNPISPFQREFRKTVNDLLGALPDLTLFRSLVEETIAQSRQSLKLPPVKSTFPWKEETSQ